MKNCNGRLIGVTFDLLILGVFYSPPIRESQKCTEYEEALSGLIFQIGLLKLAYRNYLSRALSKKICLSPGVFCRDELFSCSEAKIILANFNQP
jgi:hypothetical protein